MHSCFITYTCHMPFKDPFYVWIFLKSRLNSFIKQRKQISHLLVHSWNAHHRQGSASLKPGAQDSMQGFHVHGRDAAHWATRAVSGCALARGWTQEQSWTRTQAFSSGTLSSKQHCNCCTNACPHFYLYFLQAFWKLLYIQCSNIRFEHMSKFFPLYHFLI